jgi:transposase-like protein
MLEQFQFTDELKERLVLMVVFQNQSPKELAKKYGLPNVHMLINWVRIYKRTLEKGAVTLAPMQPIKGKDTSALKQRIKQLEKSLEKANVMIYGLNAMIDYAEKELKVPVRKKHGTKR